jgi:lipid A ethanolaminephosphotransferase
VPNIFQYAKAMGYQTHFLDGQKETYWLGTSYDKAYVDDWQMASNFASSNPYERDAMIAKKLSQITENSSGHFIWVIKLGAHYPYDRAFPPSAGIWQPSESSERIDPAKKVELINAYDNAVKYNLESFFEPLGVSRWNSRNLLVYTSDHGQTLSEHGEQHTHCGTGMDTFPTEAMVPLFIISRAPLAVDTGYRASHANIFATLLDLMNFPASERHHEYARSLLTAKATDSQPRYFWAGGLNEKTMGTKLSFDR